MFTIWNNRYIIGIAVLLSLGLLLYFLYSGPSASKGEVFNVVLGADGFEPNNLTINKNDTVIFTTTKDKTFWPASDLHPTHGIYPEFDPRQPIEPNKEQII
ncbi:MAG: hypothetical protein A3B86_03950 [Candidatus Yanofskybacteria bacterium RIFCSPHIGHO2_02_FULL_38_22b]|uniref:EfeO-type cupredoxin-like domain-containing protein n=1 Tax=Candidatus Yanofskybacteria bacterium RIFCSPHIGHO2_02_FULL_38_22b TaxID=1802673 RepID=A0A1F8EZE6_9BACT|nr:MAG: hypothetical protein A2816_01720 [Candidatus Yanofskybacteria bacterium RIFCSPHIGHO2_01_FULL_39_44]OGN06244.1 MAG: hypothetical protein A3B86_03950 [Candidatus Yanofskybacteria bacterium RIFCSPHIGHO2_02_FULL_38_22b]OGN19664.1 MAG: hypothetical protein A2910_03685 [Candidatus Yanofskybacteria bacterium RIFCSPLOWO2_01_FULL_39_28]